MKKAIRFIVMVLAVFSLAACSKTTMNSIAISGSWEHTKTETFVDGSFAGTWYPTTDGYRVFYNFASDGTFVSTKQALNGSAGTTENGTWLVDGNKLILHYFDGSDLYNIEHAGLLELTLKYVYNQNGHNYIDYLTFRK